MDCTNAQTLCDGYLDGELDLVRNSEFEDHLHDCAACSRSYQERRELRDAVRAHAVYFKASADLRTRVQGSLRQAAGTASLPRRIP